jgi:hypothetical protein
MALSKECILQYAEYCVVIPGADMAMTQFLKRGAKTNKKILKQETNK